ncbi:phage tail assembly chaperone [Pseudovibrio sp. Tun.PSC04-5.I4]|uniref:phage tail assembly chaperone n=1 Tax=Pseudovibrio sp. Tun.PSC04-5.I4 TaxID=1798213 RepID=UPI00117B79B6|nr:phage tail assembly chaperone [Pseudovibrio sp. Tun.PSC04-5.I4]
MPLLGWRPCDFWKASLIEFYEAIEGWHAINRKPESGDAITSSDRDELKQLMDLHRAK